MPHISTNGANWILALSGSLVFSLLGLLVPNVFSQLSDPRAHNRAKLLNEFLARHQLIYITFFLALSITSKFSSNYDWVKNAAIPMMGIILLTYVIGVYSAAIQDKHRIFTSHQCLAKGICSVALKPREIMSLVSLNAIAAIFLLIISILVTIAVA